MNKYIKTNMNGQRGFSLLEVMVSVSLFAIAATGMLPAFNAFTGTNSFSHVKVSALQAAEQRLDLLRGVDPSTLPTTGSSSPESIQIGKYNFEVTTYYCEDSSLCNGTSTRHIRVEIKKQNETIFNIQTVFTGLK